MRVVFTGQTGVEKDDVMRAVAKMAAKKEGLPENLQNQYTREFIGCYSVEAKISEILEGRIRAFLNNFYAREQQNVWNRAFQKCLEEVNKGKPKPKHAFLSFHSLYRRHGQFFSCLNWDLIRQFQPSVFVTLIDDVFDVRARVREREEKVETKSSFPLSELLSWRSSEILMTECLAQNLYPNRRLENIVVSVKNPALMLYRALFEPAILRVYTSFPISKIRLDREKQKLVNDFRLELHKHFTVFDPITIDELRFDESGNLTKRWPVQLESMVKEEISADKKMLEETEIGYSDINELRTMIERQIESRDYRWVSSSNVLVAYRPYWGKALSAGVDKEMTQGVRLSKEVFAIIDPEDKEYAMKTGPFEIIKRVVVKESIQEILDLLFEIQRGKTKAGSPESGNKKKVR